MNKQPIKPSGLYYLLAAAMALIGIGTASWNAWGELSGQMRMPSQVVVPGMGEVRLDEAGTYYLRAMVDDANDVAELDESNNLGAPVTLAVNNEIEINRMIIKADPNENSSAFSVRARLFNGSVEEMDEALSVDVMVGAYQETIPMEPVGLSGKYLYQGAKGGITVAIFNLRTGKFKIVAKEVNLAGTIDPVPVRVTFGRYQAAGEVEDKRINRGGGLPLRLQLGLEDILRVDRYHYRTWDHTRNKDWLKVRGRLSFEDHPVDLAGKEVTVRWGSAFTIPEGLTGLQQTGDREIYTYKDQKGAGITQAVFNLEKCTFRMTINHESFLNAPPGDLTIVFDDDGQTFFDETAQVGQD